MSPPFLMGAPWPGIVGGPCSCAGWDLSDLNLTGLWSANGTEYDGSPWVGGASAGTSGGRDLANGTHRAWAIGSSVNGFAPGDSDGLRQLEIDPSEAMQMSAELTFADYASATALSFWALVRPVTGAQGTGGQIFHALNSGTSGLAFSLVVTSSGALFRLTPNGGSPVGASRNAITMDDWNLVTGRLVGGVMQIGVNEVPGHSPATDTAYGSNIDLVTDPLTVGVETFVFHFQETAFAGGILSLGISDTALTDLEFCKIRCKLRDRFALALTEPAP